MKYIRWCFLFFLLSNYSIAEENNDGVFSTLESKKEFASDVSSLIGDVWKAWQDSIVINDVDVDSSYGVLLPGGISQPVFTLSSAYRSFDRKNKPSEYTEYMRLVLDAFEGGIRSWQRGYTNRNISFPQGASCTYTLPLCNNVPAQVASGESLGDREMTEEALYNFMLYNKPNASSSVLNIFSAFSKAASECFVEWKQACSISGIQASGGIAPSPMPMGQGPGPVRGAKGHNGKLQGAYLDTKRMYERMVLNFH